MSATDPIIQTPKINGKVHVTAELQNPTGTWEKDFRIDYHEGQELVAIAQILSLVRQQGLVNTVGQTKVTVIPESRVAHYTAEISRIITLN